MKKYLFVTITFVCFALILIIFFNRYPGVKSNPNYDSKVACAEEIALSKPCIGSPWIGTGKSCLGLKFSLTCQNTDSQTQERIYCEFVCLGVIIDLPV